MQSILDLVLEYAEKYNAKKVTKINLVIGELSGFIPEWMQRYFDFISKDTIAYNAEVNVEWVPVTVQCKSCGQEFQLTKESIEFHCPVCGPGAQIEILSGRDYTLKSIEVD